MSANGTRGSNGQDARGWAHVNGGSGGRYSKAKRKARQGGSPNEPAVTQEVLEVERASMISQKQTQLETVLDRHDTLVREMFHMDHFINMVGYDPIEAKTDNTKVFQNYKSSLFNLVDKTVTSPSRPTRRARAEQAQFLKSPSISAPLPMLHTNPVTKELKGATKIETPGRVESIRRKGKGRAVDPPRERSNVNDFDDDLPSTEQSISAILIHRAPRKLVDDEVTSFAGPPKRRKLAESETEEPITVKSRRRGRFRGPFDEVTSVNKALVVNNQKMQLPLSERQNPPEALPTVSAPPFLPKFNIKRVKLLVRRPPPPITNPKQRPPPAQYNSSVDTFLKSYLTLDGQDVQESVLERQARADASIFERAEQIKKHGGFLPMFDGSFQFEPENLATSLTPTRQSQDHWDHVVDDVCHVSKLWRKRPSGQQIASQWAKAVRSYWDGRELLKERLKSQEERRLRALAKATIRIVTDEWKKAVFHIREQERLKQEAEEVRRGREHLDAILDQSGQLLETQQGDLTRGEISRSRSSSMSATYHGWGSDDDDDDDDDDDEEDEEGEREEENEEDGMGDAKAIEEDEEDVMDGDEMADEKREEDSIAAMGTSDFDEASTPGNFDLDAEDIQTEMLLDNSESVRPVTPKPDSLPTSDAEDDEPDIDGSSAIDELMNNNFRSSPPRPLLHPFDSRPTTDSEREFSEPLHQVEPTARSNSPSPPESVIPEQDNVQASSGLNAPLASGLSSDPSNVDVDKDSTSKGILLKLPIVTVNHGPLPLNPMPDHEDNADLVQSSSRDPERSTEDADNLGQASADVTILENEQADEFVVPEHLKAFAVAPVKWSPDTKIVPPLLLRGHLRPYQQSGLEWLASLHINNVNGILADEMGLGKTIQTIALLAHLACDRGIWGPHLVVVPTSVLLNWEMEFKKFLPGFKVLSYHGSQKRRKELRQGWNDKHHFNVCITSYTLASRDAHIFKRKAWYYLILDEAHMIKNFKSQRWNILLMFRSFRRLLLTGTPLQNNLTELWALLQFLMSGSNFASLKDFGDWFSNPVEKAIEMGNADDDDTMQRVTKLHTVLRPYLLRRLKRDVEKELPSKYEHLVMCPLSKRQRFLYDEFMSRAHTRDALQSGIYQKIANILMQLRKVCNHPDLFEVRPIVTSFAMGRSALADFEIQELLIRRRLLENLEDGVNLRLLGLKFIDDQDFPSISAMETRRLDATSFLPHASEGPGNPPPKDLRTITGFRNFSAYMERASTIARWSHIGYLNRLRCQAEPIYGSETLAIAAKFYEPLLPSSSFNSRRPNWESVHTANHMVKSYMTRAEELANIVDKFAFVTPAVVALEVPRFVFSGCEALVAHQPVNYDDVLHRASVKLQIAFPDPSLLQYDCGKLQELTRLLREKKAGGHRVLIFTQMTKILDILEIYLNFHGYLYLRLDGATKIEDRQYITERFNADPRIFCFIASSRSGGVGINLTGADTVVFYDSDFNPQMDRQCEDRAHRIGQIRDVHIYRFVSQHTVEEALLRKANQKRSLDHLVIEKGEFDWRSLFNDQSALSKALEEFEDTEDVHAAVVAATEEVVMQGADEADFGGESGDPPTLMGYPETTEGPTASQEEIAPHDVPEPEEEIEEGGSIASYMLDFVVQDSEYFQDWRL